MMQYEEANVEIIEMNEIGDVVTLSIGETDEVNSERWWGNL